MSDVTHLDAQTRKSLSGLLFYLLVLVALAMFVFLMGVVLGIVPVSEPA